MADVESQVAETRSFRMDPKLLFDIIERQAGTLAKAVLEGVTNGIDAGASAIHVTITNERVVIQDDGKGIPDRGSIEKYFETFGRPHDESEKKVFGTFRMGRGQMFAYGRNVWRTGTFEMDVDVKGRGLDYRLREDLEAVGGCRIDIELYNQLTIGTLADVERTVRRWVKYAPTTVVVNNEVATVDPAGQEWDRVVDEAYVKLTDTGTLSVYNLGVHTIDIGSYRYGVGGTVVSRKQLKVNFARNDIQDDCPVWKAIRPLIDKASQDRATKKKTQLSDGQRQRMTDLVAQGQAPAGARDFGLFTATNGRHYAASRFVEAVHRYGNRVTSAPLGSVVGDRVHQQRLAFVMADETVQRFGKTLYQVVRLAWDMVTNGYRAFPEIVKFEEISKGIGGKFEITQPGDETEIEKVWLQLATGASDRLYEKRETKRRKVCLGLSDVADAWTDGETYIALGRNFLRRLSFDASGFVELGRMMLHELCHGDPDTGTHTHGAEFYQEFHDQAYLIAHFTDRCLGLAEKAIESAGRRLTKKTLRDLDRLERTRNAAETVFSRRPVSEEDL